MDKKLQIEVFVDNEYADNTLVDPHDVGEDIVAEFGNWLAANGHSRDAVRFESAEWIDD